MGSSNSVFKVLGASSHSIDDREKYDYYATDPKAVYLLDKVEKFAGPIWEPACGGGHISDALKKVGY